MGMNWVSVAPFSLFPGSQSISFGLLATSSHEFFNLRRRPRKHGSRLSLTRRNPFFSILLQPIDRPRDAVIRCDRYGDLVSHLHLFRLSHLGRVFDHDPTDFLYLTYDLLCGSGWV